MKACLLALGGTTLTSALRYGIPGVPVLGGDGENGPPVPATKELTARITKDWSKWDSSGDGKLDEAELTAVLAAVHAQQEAKEIAHTDRTVAAFCKHAAKALSPGLELEVTKISWEQLLVMRKYVDETYTKEKKKVPTSLNVLEGKEAEIKSGAWAFADADADGTVTRAEMGALLRPYTTQFHVAHVAFTRKEQFKKADTDGDGELSEEELWGKPHGRAPPLLPQAEEGSAEAERTLDELIEASKEFGWGEYDADGSGKVTLAEYSAGIAKEEKNWSLSSSHHAPLTTLEDEVAFLMKEDKDGDGMLTLEEIDIAQVGHSLHDHSAHPVHPKHGEL